MRRLLLALRLLLGALLLATPAVAHQPTFSQVTIRLDAGGTAVEARLPILALVHEATLPGGSPLPEGTAEADLAGPLPPALSAALAGLLTDRLRLSSDGEALPLTVTAVEDVAFVTTAPPAAGALGVSADLFPTDTLHKTFVDVYRGEALAGQWALDLREPSFTLAAARRPLPEVAADFLLGGVVHVVTGSDHLLFVLALVLLGGPLAAQVGIVTAFTAAHAVTLTLAALGLVALPPRLVEAGIALSLVALGLHDLRAIRRGEVARRGRVALAFGFGLLHGFGFAGVLTGMDLPPAALAWSLAAFNLGVELGQFLVVVLAAPLLIALRRHAAPAVRQSVLLFVAGGVALAGGAWLWQRGLA